ncbi:hypothetical protein [Streptomyces sp. Ag109_O5-1]|uniref:hypothetical protein n=1 Tax=Streptomyces sp. Ag109_O5-1 TaxID=1938851 RepID=UPI000F5012D2
MSVIDDTMPLTTQAAGAGGPGGRRRGGGTDGDRKRRRRRVIRWSASVLALAMAGTATAGYLYYEHLNSNLKKADLNIGGRLRGHAGGGRRLALGHQVHRRRR